MELFARFKREGWSQWGNEAAMNGEHVKVHPMYRGNGFHGRRTPAPNLKRNLAG